MSNLWVRFYLYLVLMVLTPVIGVATGTQLMNIHNDITVILGVMTLIATPPVVILLFVQVVRTFKAIAARANPPAETPEQ